MLASSGGREQIMSFASFPRMTWKVRCHCGLNQMPVGFTQVSAHPFFSPFSYLDHVIISIGKCLGWRSAFKVSLALQSVQNPSRDALEIVYCPTGFFSVVPPPKQETPPCGPPHHPKIVVPKLSCKTAKCLHCSFKPWRGEGEGGFKGGKNRQ